MNVLIVDNFGVDFIPVIGKKVVKEENVVRYIKQRLNYVNIILKVRQDGMSIIEWL